MIFNKEKILIIVSGLIILSVLIFGYFQLFLNRQAELQKNIISPNIEPSPISVDNSETYSNKSLGLSFQYPKTWGEAKFEENISLNYLFPTYPPAELANEFTKRGLGNDFITTFKAWDYEKQIEFLKKDRIGYDTFLSKEATIAFSQNDKVKIHAFNKSYLDLSGYEGAVGITSIYKGNLTLNKNICSSYDLLSQIKIENFYLDDCKILSNGLLNIIGTFETDILPSGEFASLIAIGNLKSSQEYKGLLIEYSYKDYGNPGADLMTFFGYSGYGTGNEAIQNINIAACNKIQGGSAPSTATFERYFNKTIDDNFIQDFLSFIRSELIKIKGLDNNYISLITRKHQGVLENNKGKKFVDYQDGQNFNLYFEASGAVLDKVMSSEDIEKYFDQFNPNELNCSIYKIFKKQNLDSFRQDVQDSQSLREFQSFVGGLSVQ